MSTLFQNERLMKPSMPLLQVLLKLFFFLCYHQSSIVGSSFALGYFNNYPTRWLSSSGETPSLSAAATRQDELFESTTTTATINATSASYNDVVGNTHKVNVKTLDVLSLSSIRSTLIRQEETIIFGLIERAQFRSNDIVYESNGFGNLGIPDGVVITDDTTRFELERLSFLEYMLLSTVRDGTI